MGYSIIFSDTLAHHGILGQKWGKRNGPPYPLDASDHSAFEKKANWRKSLDKSKVTSAQRTANTEYFKQKVEEKKASSDLTKLNSLNSEISKLSTELATDYDNYYKDIKRDPEFREAAWKNLREDFGDGVDDEEYFDLDKNEVINRTLVDFYPPELRNKTKTLYQKIDEYFDELDDLSKDILDEYEGYDIDLIEGGKLDKNVINKWLDNKSHWNSYVYKHFDDYWVQDVDSKYELEDSFTAKEYNRRYNK